MRYAWLFFDGMAGSPSYESYNISSYYRVLRNGFQERKGKDGRKEGNKRKERKGKEGMKEGKKRKEMKGKERKGKEKKGKERKRGNVGRKEKEGNERKFILRLGT